MIKSKYYKTPLFILMFVLCLHFSGLALAGDCAGEADGIGSPTVPGEFTIAPDWHPPLQYDPANPQTIDRNNTVTISVIGGIPPYTWSVSGTGFTLEEIPDNELSYILHADGTACGAATIEITDTTDALIAGYVRCTTGQWVYKGHICGLSGMGDVDINAFAVILIEGNKQQRVSYTWHGTAVPNGPSRNTEAEALADCPDLITQLCPGGDPPCLDFDLDYTCNEVHPWGRSLACKKTDGHVSCRAACYAEYTYGNWNAFLPIAGTWPWNDAYMHYYEWECL